MVEASQKRPVGYAGVRPGRTWVKILIGIVCLGLAAMWVYGFLFASRDAVSRVDDLAWSERAEQICREANLERFELADERRIEDAGADALAERAAIIDQATLIVEQMIDDVVEMRPSGVEDQAIVETWEGFYRQLIEDRRGYTDTLRAGENRPFAETAEDGAPISEWINDFTIANEMPECSAPLDLSI
jgi:hypothetical protein